MPCSEGGLVVAQACSHMCTHAQHVFLSACALHVSLGIFFDACSKPSTCTFNFGTSLHALLPHAPSVSSTSRCTRPLSYALTVMHLLLNACLKHLPLYTPFVLCTHCHAPPAQCLSHAPPALCLSHAPPALCLSHAPPALCLSHAPPAQCLSHAPPAQCLSHAPSVLWVPDKHSQKDAPSSTLCAKDKRASPCAGHADTASISAL